MTNAWSAAATDLLGLQKRLAFAGMNPYLLADGSADFCLDAFHEAHAHPFEFISGPDRGGEFQRGLFHLAPTQVRRGVDAFECVRRFNCFHNLILVPSLIHSTTPLFYQAHFCQTANLAIEPLKTLDETSVVADT